MPSLAVTQPNYARRVDLHDAVDPVDRQLASCSAAVSISLGAVFGIRNPLDTGVASTSADTQSGKYFKPSTISTSDQSTYEGLVDDVFDALALAQDKLAAIEALKP